MAFRMKTSFALLNLVAVGIGLVLAVPANAAPTTFDLTYSGFFLGSDTATGTVTFDPTLLDTTPQDITAIVTEFSLTVTGPGVVDGTFTLPDIGEIFIDPDGTNLDFTKQLVGQTTTDGIFGENAGDFNFFPSIQGDFDGVPSGVDPFTIASGEDGLFLTSFIAEVTAAPEPSSLVPFAIAALGIGGLALRSRKSRLSSTVAQSA